MPVRKIKHKGLKVLNLALLVVVFKWHHGSEGVKGGNSPCLVLQELRSCVKVEVAVQGSPFLIVLTVSVDVKQH